MVFHSRLSLPLLGVALITETCVAFSTAPVSFMKHQAPTTVRMDTILKSHAIDSEDEAFMLMMNASTCATSDTCSIEEAEEYLNAMLHIQSNCATGTLNKAELCDDVIIPSQIISSLRQKVTNEVEVRNQTSVFGFQKLFLAIAAVYISAGMMSMVNNPDGFTAQEWMYAARDGYLGDMVAQYMKYGGLSPISESTSTILPFTTQEWFWSIRDGYFGQLVSEFQRNGGLSIEGVDMGEDIITTSRFTSEEWSMAIKDGYLSDMIEHYMRNGGL
mmetsp:Transcript_5655/g.7228  ORF Transcript_5655/g.7228 Transcript_5655/m.7228 type:complete len:273 (+) Transcript_5655:160-978(+)